MKQVCVKIVWGMLLAFTVSCSNDFDSDTKTPEDIQKSVQNDLNKRTYQEALDIAQNSISILEHGNSVTRSIRANRTIDRNAIIVGSQHIITRSASEQDDTLFYVFNFCNDEGFAVVSASKNTDGLLAVTESGHYSANETSAIEGFDMFMDLAENYVTNSMSTINVRPRPPYDFTELKDSSAVHESYSGPYVTVRWGQTYPEGIFCSNQSAGCANTAMAQVMTYYEYPTAIALTYEGADQTIQELNWSEIKKHVSTLEDSTSLTWCYAISRLCRQLGQIANSRYESDGNTYTSLGGIESTMQFLGYQTEGWKEYNSTCLTGCAQRGQIVIMAGSRYLASGEKVGHIWLLDGAYTRTQEAFTWSKRMIELEWNLVYYHTMTSYYYHINWGFDGNNNGYFCKDVFDTSKVINPDTNNNYVNRNYDNDIQYLVVYHE